MTTLERRLGLIGERFEELDKAAQALTEKLDRHKQLLGQQDRQDKVWAFLLSQSLSTQESQLLFGYVVDALKCCHTCVLEKVPELASGMPTLASVLRRRGRNRRVELAWQRALTDVGLNEEDVSVLCTFYVVHGHSCEFRRDVATVVPKADVQMLIHRVVLDPSLRASLLRAVQLAEGKRAPQKEIQKPATSIQLLLSKSNPTTE
ncbi:single-pass membrane and coiled-coil domain-containing protein 1-like [Chanos chanos]|uniref:Single-pass membrane and coiled-coil domain-containing protein 1-like n=1 Tax=Chanos chanos TaxID=29144 RepID=A0A6J2VRP6_CHACN|nr:single-pass membrane and coiled-coil domain-containing protein 1 [Chanos chanos]